MMLASQQVALREDGFSVITPHDGAPMRAEQARTSQRSAVLPPTTTAATTRWQTSLRAYLWSTSYRITFVDLWADAC